MLGRRGEAREPEGTTVAGVSLLPLSPFSLRASPLAVAWKGRVGWQVRWKPWKREMEQASMSSVFFFLIILNHFLIIGHTAYHEES